MPINDKTSRVVKMFCSTHPERWQLFEPYISKGYMYATDSFTVIKVPTDLPDDDDFGRLPPCPPGTNPNLAIGKKFPINILEPLYDKLIVQFHTVSCSQLDIIINSFKKIPVLDYSQQVECTKCYGDGVLDCPHCHQDYECPNCNGNGTVGKPRETGEMEFDSNIYVIINDTTVIQGSYLIRIREVAKELNQEFIEFLWTDIKDYIDSIDSNPCWNTQPLHCKVGDAMVTIMPLKHKKDSKLNAENIQVVTL